MKYLIDSDWLIDALNGQPSALAVLEELSAEGLAVSVIAIGELLEGLDSAPQPASHRAMLRQFLAGITLLPVDESIVEHFARNRARLRRQGMLIPDMDLLIAATALRFDLTLLTRNQRHFRRIPELRLYTPK